MKAIAKSVQATTSEETAAVKEQQQAADKAADAVQKPPTQMSPSEVIAAYKAANPGATNAQVIAAAKAAGYLPENYEG